jgi:hypothetical protein
MLRSGATVYDRIETRPATSSKQRSEGILALRKHRNGGTLLASALWRDFVEHGGSELVGEEARTPHDLATITPLLRAPRFEGLRLVFTKNRKIVRPNLECV